MTGLRVERRNYSAGAWRVVDEDGRDVYVWRSYPGRDDLPPFEDVLAFDTKKEAVEALGDLAGKYLHLRRRVLLYLDARQSEQASVIGGCLREIREAL
jgi:hypothetical protein